MGQVFKKIYSFSAREIKMYNIEKRAEKIISKEKPTPAPMYPSTIKELERLNEENVSKEYLQRKDKHLDENLKKVYVTTPITGASKFNPKEEHVSHGRPLPLSRSTDVEPLYGYSESEEESVPVGRITLKQALQLITDHRRDPQNHQNTTLAAQYKLPITLTDDILEHFKMFDLHIKKNEADSDKNSAFKKLEERVKNINFINIVSVFQDHPQFKNKPFFRNLTKLNDKEKDNIDIDLDKTNSDKLDNGKKK